jgi:hypothetical protein
VCATTPDLLVLMFLSALATIDGSDLKIPFQSKCTEVENLEANLQKKLQVVQMDLSKNREAQPRT